MGRRGDLGRARLIEDAAIQAAQAVALGRVALGDGAQHGMSATYADSHLSGGIGPATRRAAIAGWDVWRTEVEREMRRHLAEWPAWLAQHVAREAISASPEIHVLLVDLEPRVAVEALRRAADAIGIDVAERRPDAADRRLGAARAFIAARAEAAGLDIAIGDVIAVHHGGDLDGQLDFACIVRAPGAAIDEVLEAEDAAALGGRP